MKYVIHPFLPFFFYLTQKSNLPGVHPNSVRENVEQEMSWAEPRIKLPRLATAKSFHLPVSYLAEAQSESNETTACLIPYRKRGIRHIVSAESVTVKEYLNLEHKDHSHPDQKPALHAMNPLRHYTCQFASSLFCLPVLRSSSSRYHINQGLSTEQRAIRAVVVNRVS